MHNFRELGGVIAALILIVAFVLIGFVGVILTAWLGKVVTFPGEWVASMLSLASGGLGYLIGKQSSGSTTDAAQKATQDAITSAVTQVATGAALNQALQPVTPPDNTPQPPAVPPVATAGMKPRPLPQ